MDGPHRGDRVLAAIVEILRTPHPLTARDLAKQLVAIGVRIDRRQVNSVLHREGVAVVRYDPARYTSTLRPGS